MTPKRLQRRDAEPPCLVVHAEGVQAFSLERAGRPGLHGVVQVVVNRGGGSEALARLGEGAGAQLDQPFRPCDTRAQRRHGCQSRLSPQLGEKP